MDWRFFREEQVRAVKGKIPIYFVGGNLMVTGDSIFPAGIHQHSSSLDVGVQKYFRLLDGTVYMALCRKINHHIRVFFLKQLINCFPVCDALLYKTEIRAIHHWLQRGQVSGIGQAVQANDPIIRVFVQHVKNKVASDKSGSAGYDNCHIHSPSIPVRFLLFLFHMPHPAML